MSPSKLMESLGRRPNAMMARTLAREVSQNTFDFMNLANLLNDQPKNEEIIMSVSSMSDS